MNTIIELKEQIKEWQRQIEMIEDMIEAAYHRIDKLELEIELEAVASGC